MKWFHRACADLSVEEIKCEQVTSTWKCGCVKVDLDGVKLFRRYVDDMILSGKKSEINSSLERFNRLHPNLQLTIERLDGMKIPFLDMLITQNANGTLATTWYTKPRQRRNLVLQGGSPVEVQEKCNSGHHSQNFQSDNFLGRVPQITGKGEGNLVQEPISHNVLRENRLRDSELSGGT